MLRLCCYGKLVCPSHSDQHICIALSDIGDEVYNDCKAIKLLGETTVKEIELYGQGSLSRDPSLQYNIVDVRMPHKLQLQYLPAGLNRDSILTSLDRIEKNERWK